MIWTWIKVVLIFLAKLVIEAPSVPTYPKINPNAMCPSCGHEDGEIRAYDNKGQPLVQHTCKVCLAKWYEKPVLNAQSLLIKAE
jgi:hypothetical protein